MKDGKQIVCLNAIMKNESHLFKAHNSMLDTLVKFIDYWIIVDTGSTDDSIQCVEDFFKEHKIKGEIHKKPFVDFGVSRSHALKLCQRHRWIDWVLVFDVDDLLIGEPDLHKLDLMVDAYELDMRDTNEQKKEPTLEEMENGSMVYKRMCLFNNRLNWFYNDAIHEWPECTNKKNKTIRKLENCCILSRRLGDRSKNVNKFLRDAKVAEKSLKNKADNPRLTFYCARSWYDYRDYEKALLWYNRYMDLAKPGKFCFVGERYWAALEIGRCLKNLYINPKTRRDITKSQIIDAFLRAYSVLKIRVEALYELALFCREQNDFEQGYKFAKKGSEIQKPVGHHDGMFFCVAKNYTFDIWNELALNAYHSGKVEEAKNVLKKLLDEQAVPDENIHHVVHGYNNMVKELSPKEFNVVHLNFLN